VKFLTLADWRRSSRQIALSRIAKMLGWGLLLAILSIAAAVEDPTCNYDKPKSAEAPEIFWINMDKSVARRETIEMHLTDTGHLNRRVKGLSLNNIYVPEDVLSSWDKYMALTMTGQPVRPREQMKLPKHLQGNNYTHILLGLVGRGGKNKLKEIGCTSSHLEAMRQAIYHNKTASKYAVIIEDDIQIPFNIDFVALAATAPQDFGILQLFNSNEESMESQWLRYVKKGHLWADSFQQQAASFWSTCAYLINREVMKPIIDRIAYEANGWVNLKIVAGLKKPCRPKISECCSFDNTTMTFTFSHIPPCIWVAKGFQADSYIYALAKTYVLSVPLITNGAGGNVSTFHQDHVISIHQSAFARQRGYINELITGRYPLPSFATLACRQPLPVRMMVSNSSTVELPSTAAANRARAKQGV
jgi:GR25 family glycosyltransferase involved in LPS biosynthesis